MMSKDRAQKLSSEGEVDSAVLSLHRAMKEVEKYLPEQAPLHAFVHHNTLHALEGLTFEDALEASADKLGAAAYPSNELFSQAFKDGYISRAALLEVCRHQVMEREEEEIGGLKYDEFLYGRLEQFFDIPSAYTIEWLESEGLLFDRRVAGDITCERRSALRSFALRQSPEPLAELKESVWQSLRAGSARLCVSTTNKVPRASLSRVEWKNWVIPHMIRLAAAYLDQGIAHWHMPQRDRGFWICFRELSTASYVSPEPWLQGFAQTLRAEPGLQGSSEQVVIECLRKLQHPEEQWVEVLHAFLLPVRGWAGMFLQLEKNPDKAPFRRLPARLLDFVAVLLSLEVQAKTDKGLSWQGGTQAQSESGAKEAHAELTLRNECIGLAYESYILALRLSVDPLVLLTAEGATQWVQWVGATPPRVRSRLLLRAFENDALHDQTNCLTNHSRWIGGQRVPSVAYQAVFCIDDREESLRRHLEETDSHASTYSYPGFFGIAMRYLGSGEVRSRDLCPVSLKASHVVEEEAPLVQGRFSLNYHLHIGSRTLVRGYLSSLLGFFSIIPLVLGVLFPHWFALRAKRSKAGAGELRLTRDQGFSPQARSLSSGLSLGFTHEEMADIVEKLLREIGLVEDIAPAVLLIGHGSSSVNNPHLSAYGCGATAGGCGGPNGRAFAQMANDKRVQALLKKRGLCIPPETVFVGGVHDTCTDEVTLDELAMARLSPALGQAIQEALRSASELNAHERCRLFDTAPNNLSPRQAKKLVEARSVDLSEPRPEYNHARNSCCIVGQRQWTRGLFLDQRAFLVSYNPNQDPQGDRLYDVLMGSLPVGMGINLEYFFGSIDQSFYGAGSKLPHNVSGLLGVMDGHKSDLRTGLYSQMIEKHPPVRMVAVVEATPDSLERVFVRNPSVRQLVERGWVHLVSWQPEKGEMFLYSRSGFSPFHPRTREVQSFARSRDAYGPSDEPRPGAHLLASFARVAS